MLVLNILMEGGLLLRFDVCPPPLRGAHRCRARSIVSLISLHPARSLKAFSRVTLVSQFIARRFSGTAAPLCLTRRTPSPSCHVFAEITPVPQGRHAEGA